MTLQVIASICGAVFGIIGLWMMLAPVQFRRRQQAFPRQLWVAILLSTADMIWVGLLLVHMPMGVVDIIKPYLVVLVPLVIVLLNVFMEELLAVRAFGGLLLLVAAPMLDAARFHPSRWSWLVSGLAYVLILKGIVLVMSPYQFRRISGRWVARDFQCRVWGGVYMALAIVLLALAASVYAVPQISA